MDTNILRKDRPEVPTERADTPHFCYDGWVFLGYEGEDENGELIEVGTERVPCRRCNRESLLPWTNTYRRTELRLPNY